MMIGDDQRHTERCRPLRSLDRRDPAVDRHDQLSPLGVETLNGLDCEPIPLIKATRDERPHGRPQRHETLAEQRCRADPVGVVVAMHHDLRPLCDRRLQQWDRQ